jgi:acyl-CoA synthetase (AMP-forming)/AMP-acid ligase II/alkylation response protein AidB-like acyl-CoA dehydrogenase/acyl carrier protein
MERNPDLLLRAMQRHDDAASGDGLATIGARLQEHARTRPGQVAYTFLREDGTIEDITYAALASRATRLAGHLLQQAAPGARMLLLYPSGLAFITAWFACLLAGMIAVPASLPHKTRASRRLQALVADADPAVVLTSADCLASVRASMALVGAGNRVCTATDTQDLPASLEEAILPVVTPAMTAFLQYTSGSTAQPKGVEVTHGNLASNAEAIRGAFGFTPASVMASWLPLFHDMGLIGSVVAPMAVGFHAVLMAPAAFLKNPGMWLDAITQYHASCAGAPNFGWDYCVTKIRAEARSRFDLSSLDVAYNGSEPVRAATLRGFVEAFAGCGMRAAALFPCYGMAETTLFVSGGPAGRAPLVRCISKSMLEGNQVRDAAAGSLDAREVVSSGAVAASHRVVVVDSESLRPVGRQRVGEVWVAGPSVARGYWRRPAQTEAAFSNYLADREGPFLRTGDLGFMQDGELFITGRLKDLVIINGRNIYPQDVEEVIEGAMDFIAPNMCAAFSVEIDGQERLAIVAEANRSLVRAVHRQAQSDSDGAQVLVQVDLAARNICTLIGRQFDVSVSSIVFVKPGSFPRTTSGKVQRTRCKELALAGELAVVYVLPGSLFDRRGTPRPQAGAITLPVHRPAPPQNAAHPNAALSRARADAMIDWLRQYAARRLQSRVGDERRTIAPYVVLDLGNQGFFGLQVPLRLGGAGLLTSDLLRVMEQLAAIDLTLATMVGVHNGLGVRTILQSGSQAMRDSLLPLLAGGRQLAAFALTEPHAGSNPAAMRATARQVPGGWRLSAEKQWIGLAAWAGVITVFAKAFDSFGEPLGTIALLVPEDTAGLSQGPEALTMGMRGMVQNTVFLVDAFLPDSAVLRVAGEGMEVARDAMQFSRLGIGAMCVGGMKRCAQLMARYAERRSIASGRLLDHPVTLARLDELGAAIFASEALVHAIAAQLDAGHPVGVEAYLACKVGTTELFGQAADTLVQMLGGRGYIETNAAPQILRDARVLRILEGPTETLYAHLGATLGQAGGAALAFLAGAVQAPALASELEETARSIKAEADIRPDRFASRPALQQWLDYRLGELAAAAFLLGAAAARAQPEQQQGERAVAWARRRFTALELSIRADIASAAPAAASDALLQMIAAYGADIGDIDPGAPGEGQHLDPILRRLAPEPVSAPVPVESAQPELRGEAATPLQRIVHAAILDWLRSEKPGAAVVDIDFDTPFTSLGMDSLSTVSIAVDLESRTGQAIVPELLYDYQTVRTLAAYLAQRMEAPAA